MLSRDAVTRPDGWTVSALPGERLAGLQRARLVTRIPVDPEDGRRWAEIRVDLSLPDGVTWLVADVAVAYPYTEKREVLDTAQQRLRRLFDLGWIEVAPFELHPRLSGTRQEPLRVWRRNSFILPKTN